MKKMLLLVVLTAAVCPGLLQAGPISYMGRLAWQGVDADGRLSVYSGGPQAGWLSTLTSVSWEVDNTTAPGLWHYEYTITVQGEDSPFTDIQCVIIETSSTFSWDDLVLDSVGTTPSDWLVSTNIASYSRWNNGNLPSSSVYGLMFRTVAVDPTTLRISFDSDRLPVWGDIYVRSFTFGGSYSTLNNDGWTYYDTDPDDPPCNGSVLNHVLVPDSKETSNGGEPAIPAPAAILLATCGALLTGWCRRGRWL